MSIPLWRMLFSGLLLLVIIALVLAGSLVIYVRDHTKELLEQYSAKFGAPLTIGQVKWLNWHGLQFKDIRVGVDGDAVRIGEILIHWHWRTVYHDHHFDDLIINDPQVWSGKMSDLIRSIDKSSPKASASKAVETPYMVSQVVINRGILNLDNLSAGLPNIAVNLGQHKPVEFSNFPLGPMASLDPNLQQVATAEDISINSPFDPLTKVLHFETINLYFTWPGLAQNQIEQLVLKKPTVYLGPDLFWFTHQVSQKSLAATAAPQKSNTPSWTIHQMSIDGGQLIISAFGDPGVALPFSFASSASEVHLDRFHELSVKNEIQILPAPIEYPDYNISIEPVKGVIQFDIPPTQKDVNNLVQTIEFKRLSWRDIETTNAWASFTFNEKGIFGKAGGEAYKGYLNAQFAVNFSPGYPWQAWGYVTNVDTAPILEKLTKNRFNMALTSKASGEVSISARATQILQTDANLGLAPPGHLEILELNRVVDNLPKKWNGAQRDAVLDIISSFREYDFTKAQAIAHYAFPNSQATLELWSRQGHRTINLRWDQDPTLAPLSLLEPTLTTSGFDVK